MNQSKESVATVGGGKATNASGNREACAPAAGGGASKYPDVKCNGLSAAPETIYPASLASGELATPDDAQTASMSLHAAPVDARDGGVHATKYHPLDRPYPAPKTARDYYEQGVAQTQVTRCSETGYYITIPIEDDWRVFQRGFQCGMEYAVGDVTAHGGEYANKAIAALRHNCEELVRQLERAEARCGLAMDENMRLKRTVARVQEAVSER